MEAILRRLHEQQLDEEGSVSEEEEEDEELVAGLPLKKAILLAQVRIFIYYCIYTFSSFSIYLIYCIKWEAQLTLCVFCRQWATVNVGHMEQL